MATIVNYTGDGSTNTYAITFDYISRTDVVVKVDDVAAAHTFINDTTIQLTSTPANGAAITIQRTTPLAALVDFTDGSTLFEADLDLSDKQSRFLSEEARDRADSAITTVNTNIINIDAVAAIGSNVTTVAGISTDVTTVANDGADIGTVAGISGNVSTVAGISANVTTVAGVSANVSTVATNIASVNTVAANIADVITVANDLTEAISEVETVANDLNEAVSEIDTVANNITNITTVANADSNITTLAGINTNITTVANDTANIGTVAANIANVGTVAGISANVTTVAGINSNVTSVAGNETNINAVAGNAANITTVSTNNANVTTVAAGISNVNLVAGDIANVNTVAGSLSAISSVNSNITAINTVNSNSTNINTVSGSIANVNVVAAGISGVNTFANRYEVSASEPSSPNEGLLWFDTATDTMKVYNGNSFQNAGSSVNGTSSRGSFIATAGQTLFATTGYDSGYIDVFLNGVKLIEGTDFTATDGTNFVLTTGAALNDTLDYVAYGTFNLADVYTKTVSDARYEPIDATILKDADIGVNVQAYDATIVVDADIGVTVQGYDANLPTWPAAVDATEVGYLNGVTSAIQTQLDAKMTPTYTGNVDITGELIADSYNETYSALSGTTPTVDCETGNVFSLSTSGNTTFTFTNPPASGTAYGFTLKLTAGGTHTITWPSSVDWAGATAPDAPASGETNVLVFITHDGGTTWYGFQGGAAMA